MKKVIYKPGGYTPHAVLDDLRVQTPAGMKAVVCDITLMEDNKEIETRPELVDGVFIDVEVEFKHGHRFPTDLATLKQIAVSTIDHWREVKQNSGYTHTNGHTYGTDERTRSLIMGKIQEMGLLNSTSSFFPDVHGAPVPHSAEEMKAVGIGVAHKIEADYMDAVALVGQLMHPSIDTMGKIEALLDDITGEI